ncbi:hypothetical protein NM688_g8635 [Phlebia brevispora]|uniref:Uncharacterized protein n=1 Tax=Phlebia brevispora TaxID=194682 RepID=A0ACC1RPF0_9APHY|nr:hypothetical protein NM688_g8635 [Phlebia brevispora]
MKFLALFASFVVSALAQSIDITIPAPYSNITAGRDIVVQITKPVTMDPSLEEALVISMATCDPEALEQDCNGPNYDVTERLGAILYNGSYTPERHQVPPSVPPPYQNFTVQVPQLETSQVSLIVTHFSLAGIGPSPFLEVKNIVLNVTNPAVQS